MTYEEIISQVASRLGHKAYTATLKSNYRYAIRWAESELTSDAEPVYRAVEIDILPDRLEYDLPDDFGTQKQIIVMDEFGNQLSFEEVSYQKWLAFNPLAPVGIRNDELRPITANPQSIVDSARFARKVAIAINRQPSNNKVSVKPNFRGKVQIYFAIVTPDDIFGSLKMESVVPNEFQHFIIPGAVSYLAQIESANAINKNDYNAANFFKALEKSASAEFSNRKLRVQAKTDNRTRPVAARPFTWYDNPRKYR